MNGNNQSNTQNNTPNNKTDNKESTISKQNNQLAKELKAQSQNQQKQQKHLSILTILLIVIFMLSIALFAVSIVLAQKQQKLNDSFNFSQQPNGDLDFTYNGKQYRIPVKSVTTQGTTNTKNNLTAIPHGTSQTYT